MLLNHSWFGDETSTETPLVLLHEGLGSIRSWDRFPSQLAAATGRRVLAYDRLGYGQSAANPGPWAVTYLHREAETLSELLAGEGIEQAVLVGHSDGASISLLYPAMTDGDSHPAVSGIVSMAAHTFCEPISVVGIKAIQATFEDELGPRLARHHDDAAAMFLAWSEVWTSDRFRDWNIQDELDSVQCPVLAIQGSADRFGSWEHMNHLSAGIRGEVTILELADVDHWPHREASKQVVDAIVSFLTKHDL